MTGTVVSDQNSSTEKDCQDLKKAMKGFGTDEDAIIQILANRTLQERLDICANFKVGFVH